MPGAWLAAAQRLLLSVWVGALCCAGFLVAPLLFATLDDRALAGTLAGRVFSATAWLGLGCGVALLLIGRFRGTFSGWRTWLLAAMLVLVALGQFVLAPQIAGLREAGLADSEQFARLHGMASIMFVITAVLGLVLVAAGMRNETRTKAFTSTS